MARARSYADEILKVDGERAGKTKSVFIPHSHDEKKNAQE